jgi:hypothetical protein
VNGRRELRIVLDKLAARRTHGRSVHWQPRELQRPMERKRFDI